MKEGEREREKEKEEVDVKRGRKLISNKPGRPPAIVVARNGPGYCKSHARRTLVRDGADGIGRHVRESDSIISRPVGLILNAIS